MQDIHDYERVLAAGLREVAEADSTAGASPVVKATLLREVRTLRHTRRASLVKMYALAGCLFLATAVPVFQLTTRGPARVGTLPSPVAGGLDEGEVATQFYPLVYGDVPVTGGNIIRLEVPRAAYASLGLEPLAGGGSRPDLVLADVLVGEDGLARAVRFVLPSTIEERQELQP
jgi:hypothetical protein